jgi:hypothetical protein
MCKTQGHTITYCISPGGEKAEKTIEETRMAQHKDQVGKKFENLTLTPVGKFPVSSKGTNGQVFTTYMDTPLPTDPVFTGAATMDTSLLIPLSDTIEHACWIAMEDNLHVTVDWTKQTHLINMTALNASNITHLSRTIATLVSCITHAYLLDTEASVHVTSDSNDFKILHPFNPCSVNGLGGSSVTAIGIVNVHLHIGKGVHIVLHDVLYIPDASVLLISIQCITRDSKVVAHFSDSSCRHMNPSGTTIAHSSLLSHKNLYSLSIGYTTAEYALFTYGALDLATWHCHLGHVNYQFILDMMNNSNIKGTSASTCQPPPKCDFCILGKQTTYYGPKERAQGDGHKATRCLEKVWVDLAGPNDVASHTGSLNIVDDYSNYP